MRLPVALALVGALAACGPEEPAVSEEPSRSQEPLAFYVGTYTGPGGSEGIYRFTLDPETGQSSAPVLVAPSENPSFLALHPRGGVLYAVNETADFRGGKTGAVSAFAIDGERGGLRLLNQQPSEGAHPCHLVIDAEGRHVLVANYTSGTVAVLPIRPDGSLGPASSVVAHSGSGPNAARQEAPHAHGLAFDPSGQAVLVADLGADRLFHYRYDPADGTLAPGAPEAAVSVPGSGPRHVAFSPSGGLVYAIDELSSAVSVFPWPGSDPWKPIQIVTTLPEGFGGDNSTAELALSPDGRFLYGSNRGHDSLAVFALEEGGARLVPAGHLPAGGRTPRHFALDASGTWLLAAHQGSDTIAVFRRDPESGSGERVGDLVEVSKPVCVLEAPSSP